MVRTHRTVDCRIPLPAVVNVNLVGMKSGEDERRQQDRIFQLLENRFCRPAAHVTGPERLEKHVVVKPKRPGERFDAEPGFEHYRKAVNRGVDIEELHRVSDAEALTIGDHSDAWAA